MPFSFAPRPEILESTPSSRIGESLVSGLGNVAQNYLNQQAYQRQQSELAKALGSLGISQQEAQGIAGLPPHLQQAAFKERSAAPGRQQFATALQAILGGEQLPPEAGQNLNQQQLLQLANLAEQTKQTKIANEQKENAAAETARRNAAIEEENKQRLEETQRKNLTAEEQKRQANIERTNAPFLKELTRVTTLSNDAFNLARQLKDLENTGNVESGYLASKKPTSFLSPESQQYLSKTKDLVDLLAANTGVASKYKLQLKEESKPSIAQSPEARSALVDDLLRKTGGIKLKETIKDAIIEKEGKQPANIDKEINKHYKQLEGSLKKTPNNFIVKDDDLGLEFINRGQLYWEPVEFQGEI